MRNKIFQWLWFKIIKPLTKVGKKDIDNPLTQNTKRFMRQIFWSKFFRGPDYILLGHSNMAVITESYDAMSEFNGLVLGLAQGGTTATDYLIYFCSAEGRQFFNKIKKMKIVCSLAGNYALQNKMKDAYDGLRAFHDLFPNSIIINEPPARYGWLEKFEGNITAEEWKKRFVELNKMISEIWQERVIDVYSFVNNLDLSDDEKILVFKDIVHYNKYAVLAIATFLRTVF